MAVVMLFVREPDLWIVITLVIVIGISFFRRELKAGSTNLESEAGSDKSEI